MVILAICFDLWREMALSHHAGLTFPPEMCLMRKPDKYGYVNVILIVRGFAIVEIPFFFRPFILLHIGHRLDHADSLLRLVRYFAHQTQKFKRTFLRGSLESNQQKQ